MTSAERPVLCKSEPVPVSRYAGWQPWVETAILALLFLLFVRKGFLPAWKHLDSDFANYYLVAHLYSEGYPVERVYDWTWFQRQKDHVGLERPLVGFIPSTLTSSLLVRPLVSLSPLAANRCWLVISFGLLLLAGAVLKRISNLNWRWVGVLMFLPVAPLHNNFLLGQVHVVLLLLLSLAAWLDFLDWQYLSGIVLAIAAAMKIYPALFLPYFLVKRRWRAAVGLAGGCFGALLIAAGLFGLPAIRTYFSEVLPCGLRGENIDPYATGWDSLTALLHRLFIFEPELNPAPVTHSPVLYAFLHALIHALILITFLWLMAGKTAARSQKKLEWGIYCFLLLLLSSEPLPYHFIVLILTAVLVVDYLVTHRQTRWAGVVVAIYTLVSLPYDHIYRKNPRGWASLLFFPRLLAMSILAAILLRILLSNSGESLAVRVRSRSFAIAAVSFAAIATIGFVFDARHLAGQFDNYRMRITKTFGSAIAVNPAVTADSVFYEALVPQFTNVADSYFVYQLRRGAIELHGGGGDWFFPTAAIAGNLTWAEVAATGKSRIVRFLSSGSETKETVVTEISDAEQPAASFEGKQLAFIREMRGRGSLWIRVVQGKDQGASARQLVGSEYDVREAAFSPQGQVVFSSAQQGNFKLYVVHPEDGVVAALDSVRCSARYPGFSLDGKWMAFSCERRGVWQLVAINRQTGEQRQLTTADCNSITPVWTPDSRSLIYATDCGRGLGITALSEITVVY